MSDVLLTTLITVAGTIIVACIGIYTARVAYRSSKSQKTIEANASVIAGYGKLNDDLQEANQALTRSVNEMRGDIEKLEAGQRADRRRIYELESATFDYKAVLHALDTYAMALGRALAATGAPVPAAPQEVLTYRATPHEL